MELTPAHTLNLTGVLSESKRIYRANSGHFLGLSLFFLPLAFALYSRPTLCLSFTFSDVLPGDFFTSNHSPKLPPNDQNAQIFHLIYFLIVYMLSICAIATITHSTYRGFSGEPVKLSSAIRSLIGSFFPIVSTAIIAHALICLISLGFLLLVGSIINLGQTLGLVIDYNSIYFMLFSAVVGVILGLIILYFQVNWSLAFAIVVAESQWGFAPLMRSSYLVRGMKSVSLSLMMLFGILTAFWLWTSHNSMAHHDRRNWGSVLISLMASSFLILIWLRNTAANTVLYMYCKALHGELAIEVAEDFDREYISLIVDDEKAPNVA